MSRLKPTQNEGVIGKLGIPIEKAIDDYFTSKRFDNEKSFKTVDLVEGFEYFIPKIRREHNYYKDAQAQMLERVEIKRKKHSRFKRILFLEQRRLRKNFIHINSILKELTDRKQLAIRKFKQEQKEQNNLRKLLDDAQDKFNQLEEFRTKLTATVDEYKPYDLVMKDVILKSNIYTSEKDCSDRCEALLLSQVEAVDLIEDKIRNMEIIRKNFIKLTKEVALNILGMQNILAELTRAHANACAEVHKWEKYVGDIKGTINKSYVDEERIYDCVNTLYNIMCKRRNVEPIYKRNQLEQELDFIKNELEVLKKVETVYNEYFPSQKKKKLPKC